jgi:hypothetical protein
MSKPDLLTALQIHSVEARHASEVRSRGQKDGLLKIVEDCRFRLKELMMGREYPSGWI